MCGIMGVYNPKGSKTLILQGLEALQYRGYDSAGLTLLQGDTLHTWKSLGPLHNLKKHVEKNTIEGIQGLGHTRWATHGGISMENAHPHTYKGMALVHNGIFHNIDQIFTQYHGDSHALQGQTDTEKALHVCHHIWKTGDFYTLGQIIHRIFSGHFSCVIMAENSPGTFFVACQGQSPLVVARKGDELMISSDVQGLGGYMDECMFLESGDWGVITSEKSSMWNMTTPLNKALHPLEHRAYHTPSPLPYRHFMQKEIYEQPLLWQGLWEKRSDYRLPFGTLSRLHLVGCGSAYHAACVGRYFFSSVPVQCHEASEYHGMPLSATEGVVYISQSGETLDLLNLLPHFHNQDTTAIVNVPHSSLGRRVPSCFYTHAGVEYSVASTKAWSCQVLVLLMLSLSGADQAVLGEDFFTLDFQSLGQSIEQNIPPFLGQARHIILLGRAMGYALAQEAALKINEVAYIPSQALSAGGLKHGPLALLDDDIACILLCPFDAFFQKNISTLHELTARQGKVWVLTDAKGYADVVRLVPKTCIYVLPETSSYTFPFVYGMALQALAYGLGVCKDTSIDFPRNLAKSVTVE